MHDALFVGALAPVAISSFYRPDSNPSESQIHRRTWRIYWSKAGPNCRRIFASSNGICAKLAVANTSKGATNIGSHPTQKCDPERQDNQPQIHRISREP